MDSPYINPSSSRPRSRTDSTLSNTSTTEVSSIRKQSTPRISRPRSISSTNIDRYRSLLPEQIQTQLNLTSGPLSNNSWTSSHISSQSHLLSPPSIQEIAPTPVFEEQQSYLPSLDLDRIKRPITEITSAENKARPVPPTSPVHMASLGYLPPPQYGSMAFHDPSFDPHYQSLDSKSQQQNQLHSFYNHGSFSSQPMYVPGPLSTEPSYSAASIEPSLTHINDPMSNINRGTSPFSQPVYEGLDYSGRQLPSSRSISHSPMSTHLLPVGSISPQLNNGLDRSPNFYESNIYPSSFTSPSVQPAHQIYHTSQSFSYPPPQPSSNTTRSRPGSESHVRVLNQKPKPQCWEHGCNGREFSTFSNLLRHQREKSGTAAKSYCPKCGAEFTRTTARNGHLAHEKCSKQRRSSTEDK